MGSRIILSVITCFFLSTISVHADPQYQRLAPPFKNLKHPKKKTRPGSENYRFEPQSDLQKVLRYQSPVQSQKNRGTCSIFSAIALLESHLLRGRLFEKIDLSEEWLEYVIMAKRGPSASEGSSSGLNFRALAEYGFTTEKMWEYDGDTWEDLSTQKARDFCNPLSGSNLLDACLLGHRDPRLLKADDSLLSQPGSNLYDEDFLAIRESAIQLRDQTIEKFGTGEHAWVPDTDRVKELLSKGIPLTLDADFYYGSWNHRKAEELNIPRSDEQWRKGIVGYPIPNSADHVYSKESPAGHSILVVGYDDDATVEVKKKMVRGPHAGKIITKTFRGVYYFKNSWGTEGFGSEFEVNGKVDEKRKGYGIITQSYAHDFGAFYRLPIKLAKD